MRYSSEMPSLGFVSAAWVKSHYSILNSTLYAWIADGRFPAPIRIGPRATRFDVSSLRRFEETLTATIEAGDASK